VGSRRKPRDASRGMGDEREVFGILAGGTSYPARACGVRGRAVERCGGVRHTLPVSSVQTWHELGHCERVWPGFSLHWFDIAQPGQSFALSLQAPAHTPHLRARGAWRKGGGERRAAGRWRRAAGARDPMSADTAARGGGRGGGAANVGRVQGRGRRDSRDGAVLVHEVGVVLALAVLLPVVAVVVEVGALGRAKAARGGAVLDHVVRRRLALALLSPRRAALLHVAAHVVASAARVRADVLHVLRVVALALAVLAPDAARGLLVVAEAAGRRRGQASNEDQGAKHIVKCSSFARRDLLVFWLTGP